MEIRTDEISSIIRQQIESFDLDLRVDEVGTVLEVGDGIARVYGLEKAMASEMVEFENGSFGLALNLEEDSVGVVILGNYFDIREGQTVKRTGRVLSVPAGEALIGRVVNPLSQPIDGKGPIETTDLMPIEGKAPGIADRQPVKEPLMTGIKAIDGMIPIGRGQRELIIGDRETGKSSVAIDAIINQRGKDVVCVYVAIGLKASTVASVVEGLREHGAMDYTIVVSATANDPAPMQYIAPYAGCAMAEYFMYNENRHTLCVYDDLSKQAASYRQLSLLLRRPPGREAYPGDVFYCHSRLLERSAKLGEKLGGGSLTALPIIETQAGDVSAYIPTNVISITDGQIYLEPDLFYAGVRPAVNVGISVSRVGGNAQTKAMKKVAGKLRLDLAQYRELEAFAQFASDLDAGTKRQLARGERIVEVLKQINAAPWPMEEQVATIFAVGQGLMDDIPVEEIKRFESEMIDALRDMPSEALKAIKETGKLEDDTAATLKEEITKFKKNLWESEAPPAPVTPAPADDEAEAPTPEGAETAEGVETAAAGEGTEVLETAAADEGTEASETAAADEGREVLETAPPGEGTEAPETAADTEGTAPETAAVAEGTDGAEAAEAAAGEEGTGASEAPAPEEGKAAAH